MLTSIGSLQDFGVIDTDTSDINQMSKYNFWSQVSSNPALIVNRMSCANIGIVGDNPLSINILNILEKSDVKQVVKINQVTAASINSLNKCDIIVSALHNDAKDDVKHINNYCNDTGSRWIRIAIDGPIAFIGPTVIPRQTACMTCVDLRACSNDAEPSTYFSYVENLQKSSTGNMNLDPAFAALVASQSVLEIIKLITGFSSPATVGRILEIRVDRPNVSGHDILKVPRCPTCGTSSSNREAWDYAIAPQQTLNTQELD